MFCLQSSQQEEKLSSHVPVFAKLDIILFMARHYNVQTAMRAPCQAANVDKTDQTSFCSVLTKKNLVFFSGTDLMKFFKSSMI